MMERKMKARKEKELMEGLVYLGKDGREIHYPEPFDYYSMDHNFSFSLI